MHVTVGINKKSNKYQPRQKITKIANSKNKKKKFFSLNLLNFQGKAKLLKFIWNILKNL